MTHGDFKVTSLPDKVFKVFIIMYDFKSVNFTLRVTRCNMFVLFHRIAILLSS